MEGEIALPKILYLVLGTAAMIIMTLALIVFTLVSRRRLARKAKEYHDIEKLMQKQELQSAYFLIEGQENERKRIAGELHDNLGGLLATLKIYSDLALNRLGSQDSP